MRIASDKSVRVVVLAASGKGFCAGHDLKEIRALKELPKIEALFGQCSRMMQTITALPQPVIARVQGAAAAAGCQLVAQCDLAVAVGGREVHHAGRHLGLLLLDARRRGRPQPLAQARDGDAAHRRADRRAQGAGVGPGQPCGRRPPSLTRRPQKLATQIAREAAGAVAAGKRAFYQQMDLGVAKAYELASGVISASFAHDEGRAGMDAFLEKGSRRSTEALYHPRRSRGGGWPTRPSSKRAG